MAQPKQTIRVLMADDHVIFRDGLRKLLESEDDIKIVGEASNGNECVRMLNNVKPDVLLLDLRMPGKDGLAVLEETNLDSLATRIIVLTAAEDERDAVRAMRLGARGIVLKQSASDLLVKSIHRVHGGEIWLDNRITAEVMKLSPRVPIMGHGGINRCSAIENRRSCNWWRKVAGTKRLGKNSSSANKLSKIICTISSISWGSRTGWNLLFMPFTTA